MDRLKQQLRSIDDEGRRYSDSQDSRSSEGDTPSTSPGARQSRHASSPPSKLTAMADITPLIAAATQAGADLNQWRQLLANARDCLGGPCKHLFQLYQRATSTIDMETHRKLPEYAQLWTEYARLQSKFGSVEETRATFKYLKNEGIGQNYRYFYSAWASFEEQHNNADKSLDIVRKGRHCDKPSADLSDQEDAFKLFWELESRCIHCSRKRRSDPPGAGSAEGVPLAPVSAADSASSATLSSAFSSSSGPAGSAASSAAQPLPPSGNTATGAIHHRAVLQTATLLPTLTVAAAESTEPDRSGASQDVSLASRSSLSSTSASASDVTAPLAAELSQLGITPAKRLKLDPSRLLSTASKNRHRLHRPVEARFLGPPQRAATTVAEVDEDESSEVDLKTAEAKLGALSLGSTAVSTANTSMNSSLASTQSRHSMAAAATTSAHPTTTTTVAQNSADNTINNSAFSFRSVDTSRSSLLSSNQNTSSLRAANTTTLSSLGSTSTSATAFGEDHTAPLVFTAAGGAGLINGTTPTPASVTMRRRSRASLQSAGALARSAVATDNGSLSPVPEAEQAPAAKATADDAAHDKPGTPPLIQARAFPLDKPLQSTSTLNHAAKVAITPGLRLRQPTEAGAKSAQPAWNSLPLPSQPQPTPVRPQVMQAFVLGQPGPLLSSAVKPPNSVSRPKLQVLEDAVPRMADRALGPSAFTLSAAGSTVSTAPAARAQPALPPSSSPYHKTFEPASVPSFQVHLDAPASRLPVHETPHMAAKDGGRHSGNSALGLAPAALPNKHTDTQQHPAAPVPTVQRPNPVPAPAAVPPASQQPVAAAMPSPVPVATASASVAAVAAVAPAPSQDVAIVRGVQYIKLEAIGKGGSSKVFRVLSPDHRIYALKEVDLAEADEATVASFKNEIHLLERLRGEPRIILLHGWDLDEQQRVLRLVMECGDVDLAHMLQDLRQNRAKTAESPAFPHVDENHLRLYFQQMLEAVRCIHAHRIIHGDLKPANFLSVHGALKLIDFGIACGMQDDHTSVVRESQIGTVNYMSPEAIQSTADGGVARLKIGPASDVWSLGCILYLMVYGETPFQRLTLLQKLRQIPNPAHVIDFKPVANKALLQVMKACLERDFRQRPTIEELLAHKFLHPETAVQTPTATVRAQARITQSQVENMAGINPEQLAQLLSQLPALGSLSPSTLSRHILSQLGGGAGHGENQGRIAMPDKIQQELKPGAVPSSMSANAGSKTVAATPSSVRQQPKTRRALASVDPNATPLSAVPPSKPHSVHQPKQRIKLTAASPLPQMGGIENN